MVRLTVGDGVVMMMVYLGCREVLVFGSAGNRIVDIERRSYQLLDSAWKSEFPVALADLSRE